MQHFHNTDVLKERADLCNAALSTLGKQSYLAYWSHAITHHVLSLHSNRAVTIQQISEATAMLPEDIAGTLLHMGVLGSKRKDGSVVLSKESVREWAKANKVDGRAPVESKHFVEMVTREDGDGW